jgi:hypothetical protein
MLVQTFGENVEVGYEDIRGRGWYLTLGRAVAFAWLKVLGPLQGRSLENDYLIPLYSTLSASALVFLLGLSRRWSHKYERTSHIEAHLVLAETSAHTLCAAYLWFQYARWVVLKFYPEAAKPDDQLITYGGLVQTIILGSLAALFAHAETYLGFVAPKYTDGWLPWEIHKLRSTVKELFRKSNGWLWHSAASQLCMIQFYGDFWPANSSWPLQSYFFTAIGMTFATGILIDKMAMLKLNRHPIVKELFLDPFVLAGGFTWRRYYKEGHLAFMANCATYGDLWGGGYLSWFLDNTIGGGSVGESFRAGFLVSTAFLLAVLPPYYIYIVPITLGVNKVAEK